MSSLAGTSSGDGVARVACELPLPPLLLTAAAAVTPTVDRWTDEPVDRRAACLLSGPTGYRQARHRQSKSTDPSPPLSRLAGGWMLVPVDDVTCAFADGCYVWRLLGVPELMGIVLSLVDVPAFS